jgi:hypothetical protein
MSGAAGFLLGGLAVWGVGHFYPCEDSGCGAEGYGAGSFEGSGACHQAACLHGPATPAKVGFRADPGAALCPSRDSVLRDTAKTSGHPLKKEAKGAKVTLEALEKDGWARVTDGAVHGWMRASVLGVNPPNAN